MFTRMVFLLIVRRLRTLSHARVLIASVRFSLWDFLLWCWPPCCKKNPDARATCSPRTQCLIFWRSRSKRHLFDHLSDGRCTDGEHDCQLYRKCSQVCFFLIVRSLGWFSCCGATLWTLTLASVRFSLWNLVLWCWRPCPTQSWWFHRNQERSGCKIVAHVVL